MIEAIGATLEAGSAIVAVLLTGASTLLDDAVARVHGRLIADDPVDAQALGYLGPQLLAAVVSHSEIGGYTPEIARSISADRMKSLASRQDAPDELFAGRSSDEPDQCARSVGGWHGRDVRRTSWSG